MGETSHRRGLDRGRLTNKNTAILGATVTAQGGYKSSGVFMARGEDFSQEELDRGWFTIFILMDFPMHVV